MKTPNKEPISLDLTTTLYPCDSYFTDQFIVRTIWHKIIVFSGSTNLYKMCPNMYIKTNQSMETPLPFKISYVKLDVTLIHSLVIVQRLCFGSEKIRDG